MSRFRDRLRRLGMAGNDVRALDLEMSDEHKAAIENTEHVPIIKAVIRQHYENQKASHEDCD